MLVPTTAPAEEPITLSQARLQVRLTDDDETDEDTLFKSIWIPAARRTAEALTNRSFVTQGWRLVLDCFPCCIELERSPVQLITSLVYRDMAGGTQTMTFTAPSNGVQRSTDGTLVVDLTSDMARIAPAFGCVWPIALPEMAAIAVNYTAGYGNAAAVPEGIKNWMLMRVARMYETREEPVDGKAAPCYLDGMLEPYCVVRA